MKNSSSLTSIWQVGGKKSRRVFRGEIMWVSSEWGAIKNNSEYLKGKRPSTKLKKHRATCPGGTINHLFFRNCNILDTLRGRYVPLPSQG